MSDMSGTSIARFMRGAAFGGAYAVAGVALCMMPGAMAAQHKDLPPGPNRELVYQRCQICHDLDNLYEAAGATREAWDGTLDLMVAFGLSVTPEQRAMILDYLATSMGPNPGNPGPAPQFAGRP
jgi:hypothetical protein